MPNNRKLSQEFEFAKALSEVVSRAGDLRPADIVAELEQIKAKFLLLAGKAKRLRLETRRRVAEWKLKLLCERDAASKSIERHYASVRRLGFTDLETEATIKIYLAHHRIRHSRARDARRVLESLAKKLGSSPKHAHLRQDIARVMSSLKGL
jgi:hypothetical protein